LYTTTNAQNSGWSQQQPQEKSSLSKQLESTVNFDISDLSAGVYNIRLTGEGKLKIKQIVKQ
jgi:hypothetical protein